MRLSLITPRADAAPAQRLSPSSPRTFADRLTAAPKAEPEEPALDVANAELEDVQVAAFRERLKEYYLQIEFMQMLMLNPGPMPTLERE